MLSFLNRPIWAVLGGSLTKISENLYSQEISMPCLKRGYLPGSSIFGKNFSFPGAQFIHAPSAGWCLLLWKAWLISLRFGGILQPKARHSRMARISIERAINYERIIYAERLGWKLSLL